MLTLDQYFKLQRGDQVRLYREIYTVHVLVDEGTHVERIFISETGRIQKNAVYIVHLMAYHGHMDMAEAPEASAVEGEPRVLPADRDGLSPEDEAELKAYELAELI